MTEYKEPGHALKGERILAQARRINKPRNIQMIQSGNKVIYQSTKLVQSAYCIIEVPLIAVLK